MVIGQGGGTHPTLVLSSVHREPKTAKLGPSCRSVHSSPVLNSWDSEPWDRALQKPLSVCQELSTC